MRLLSPHRLLMRYNHDTYEYSFIHYRHNLFIKQITKWRIHKYLEKSQKLETYDSTGDPWRACRACGYCVRLSQAIWALNFKIFILTRRGVVMTWFKDLKEKTISSWRILCDEFTSYFKKCKCQANKMSVLSTNLQKNKESLQEYIDRFTKE